MVQEDHDGLEDYMSDDETIQEEHCPKLEELHEATMEICDNTGYKYDIIILLGFFFSLL